MKSKYFSLAESIFCRSSWVIFLAILCLMLFEHETARFNEDFSKLQDKLITLEKEKHDALELNSELKLRINSQSDPAWLELVLIKSLGLVPEGQKKVIFKTDNGS